MEVFCVLLVVALLMLLFWSSSTLPPQNPSYLQVGAHYRVKTSFTCATTGHQFHKGEILIFVRERQYVPVDAYDHWSEHDYWVFRVPDTGEEKVISGVDEVNCPDEEWSQPRNWRDLFESAGAKPK